VFDIVKTHKQLAISVVTINFIRNNNKPNDMKKYLMIFIFLSIGFTMQSQVLITLLLGDKLNTESLKFGLEGGVNWTQITGMETKSLARKWNLGFYFDIRLKNQWYLNTGVLVKSNMGVDELTANDLAFLNATIYTDDSINNNPLSGSYSQKMNYFLVPVLAKYKFKNNFYIAAGPQFGLMYKAWIQFDSDIEGNEANIKQYNKDDINRIDAGIMGSFGYSFWGGAGLSIGVKYYEGFVNVYKGTSGTRNRSIFITATMPIGASQEARDIGIAESEKRKEKKAAKKAAKDAHKIENNQRSK